MKVIFITFLIGMIFFLPGQAQIDPSAVIASKIAQKMKDSLVLTLTQKEQLYGINIQMANEKKLVWNQYAGKDSLIRIHLQRIESSRDSLYKPVLTEEQFSLYRLKKRSLVNNN